MTELLTSAQMRAIEKAAIDAGEVTGLELMERAGQGVVDAVLAEWPELAARGSSGVAPAPAPGALPRTPEYLDNGKEQGPRAVVLCGPGNNGGDGYVVARLLRDRGWGVEVFALAPPATPDARAMAALWPGKVAPLSALDWPDLRGAALAVDALFGTGLVRDVAPGVWGALAMAQEAGCRLVAVDILSGICADSGRVRAEGGYVDFPAALTVTFQEPKLGHVLSAGGGLSGPVRVVPIGLDRRMDDLLRRDGSAVVGAAGPCGLLEKGQGNKFTHGHALILSGPSGRGGAARLAARGALRIGAGLVTVGVPPEAVGENAARLDAVMLREVGGAEDLGSLLADRRINALCLGPGLGTGPGQAALVAAALSWHLPEGPGLPLIDATDAQVKAWYRHHGHHPACVLDADALTLLARDPQLSGALHDRCVLTPHGGEFARLFPDLAARLEAPVTAGPACSKVDATREAAARAGCVVLFKGPDTVIADPSGRCAVNAAVGDRAAPWLATAGAGDVLAGFIAGLLARGFSPFDAACTGAWLHVEAAREFGPGLIAEDLPEMLPKLFRRIL